MASANLKSDDFCFYNESAAPFYYTFQSGQYSNEFSIGECGIFAQGGANGSYIPGDAIDISSFLEGRNDILSKCLPPVPSLDSLRQEPLSYQSTETSILLPKYTKNLRSENNIDSIDYNRYQTLLTEPQNLRFVIEDFTASRGGISTQQFVKNSWSNQNGVPNFDKNLCMINLDPARMCDGCSDVNGYPGVDWISGEKKSASYISPGKPPGQPDYPFVDITSQEIFNTNSHCGPEFFYGPNFDQGACPTVTM
jgi:hypothetical protein